MFGFTGKTLRVNLTSKEISEEDNSKYYRDFLTSSGYAAKILYDELKEWVTPFDPANKVIFSAGALIGTLAPGACKANISTIGPMTGGWATSSSDSYVGMELKHAGYDAVIIEGRSHLPCYLYITDEKVEIRDALSLWGKTTWETLDAIREEHQDPKLHIISIGPAGENLVRGASTIQDRGRGFGRCGTGAVLGSKNLKAIVCKGKKPIKIADPDRFYKIVKDCRQRIVGHPQYKKFRKYATLGIFEHKQEMGAIPYKNSQESIFPEDAEVSMDPVNVIDKYTVSKQNFPGCPIGCGRHVTLTDGPYKGLTAEFNHWEAFGTIVGRCAVSEPTFMVKVTAVCNQLGVDFNLAGNSIAWAMECYQRGILTEEDTDGMALEWGDEDVILELIRKITYREGFGNILAEGNKRAADIVGRDSHYYAMHIKGQDVYESLRGSNAWALGATVSTRGGGHTTGTCGYEQAINVDNDKAYEVLGVKNVADPLSYEGKAEVTYYFEILHRMNNSTGICHQNTVYNKLEYINIEDIAEMLSAATGIETSKEDLEDIAMRQLNLEKAINARFTNFTRKDDLPTERDQKEPLHKGKMDGWKLDMDKWNQMLDRYYELHGWDIETGYPTRKTLTDYGLGYVADELEEIGKLGKERSTA
ncbi:aldehyde ferredoxin oxidoreductase family protein [bacterium]|nr:aldehyde ferredoxin oxidoreductase family protein [bacterium]